MILIERVKVGFSLYASICGISELTVNIQSKRLANKECVAQSRRVTHCIWKPLLDDGSSDLRLPVMMMGADFDGCSKTTVPVTAEFPESEYSGFPR